jgi:hypothetical protein
MMKTTNTFTSLKPNMKETYAGKNKRFQKIQSRLRKEHQEHDKKCGCMPKKDKCECKK